MRVNRVRFRANISAAIGVAMAVALAAPAAAAVVLVDRMTTAASGVLSAETLENAADSFRLDRSATLTGVRFRGGFADGRDRPIAFFDIAIHASDPRATGGPAHPPVHFFKGVASATPDRLGAGSGLALVTYALVLDGSFAALADTTYWLSIRPADGTATGWGWAYTASDGSSGAADPIGSGGGSPRNGSDSGTLFQLLGNPALPTSIPLPTAAGLAGLGLVVLARRGSRR